MSLDRVDLRPYQHRAVEFIKNNDNCMAMVACGLGKTATSLTAFSDLLSSFEARRALVVAPKRVASKVWSDEVQSWAHLQGINVARMIGTASERIAALRTPADLHTINRENMQWLEAQFIQDKKQIMRWPWDMVILDESQSFKSQTSERFKSLKRLRKLFPRCVLLSGTPMPNTYGDLWSQYYLLDQGKRLGFTEKAFNERWFDPPRQGGFSKWMIKPHSAKEILSAVADITLSLRAEDYMDLPPVMYNFISVTLSPGAMQVYKKMEREYIAEVRGATLTAVNAGALDNKLLQLANGVVYTGEGREFVEFHEEKVAALEELVEGVAGKLLVAYYYKHDLIRIQKALERSGRKWAVLRTDDEFAAWAAGEYDVGVLHPASAGHGLNDVYKSGCEDLVHYGLTNNLEWYQQVNARLDGGHRRVGRNVKIHHIVAERTRDDDYVDMLKRKAYDQDECTRTLAVKVFGG